MTYDELLEIFPPGTRVICETVEQRRIVTEIALDAGIARASTNYADRVLDGTADTHYMNPYHREVAAGSGRSFLTYNCYTPYGMEKDISYEVFMEYVYVLDGDDNLECGEIESLLI